MKHLLCPLLLALTTHAADMQLNLLIEPGAFRPGHFSTPAPSEAARTTAHSHTEQIQRSISMGLASHTERLAAEQAALYADMRLSKGKHSTELLRKLADKSRELQDLLALQTKEGAAPARHSLAAQVKAAYYTDALQQDTASAKELQQAAEAYRQEVEKCYNSGLTDRTELLLAEITVQEATLLNSKGANAATTQQKYDELAELLHARARTGMAPTAPAEQAAEASRLFAREWARYRLLKATQNASRTPISRKERLR